MTAPTWRAADEASRRILTAHMRAGVTIEDPSATWIDADVEIAPDARSRREPTLRGAPASSGAAVGPMTTLIDSSG